MAYPSNDDITFAIFCPKDFRPRGSKMKETEYNFIEIRAQVFKTQLIAQISKPPCMLPVSSWWCLPMEKNP